MAKCAGSVDIRAPLEILSLSPPIPHKLVLDVPTIIAFMVDAASLSIIVIVHRRRRWRNNLSIGGGGGGIIVVLLSAVDNDDGVWTCDIWSVGGDIHASVCATLYLHTCITIRTSPPTYPTELVVREQLKRISPVASLTFTSLFDTFPIQYYQLIHHTPPGRRTMPSLE